MEVKDIIEYEEFKKLDVNLQKEKLIVYRNMFTNNQILQKWKISLNTLYGLIEKLGLPVAKRNPRNKKPKTEKTPKTRITKVDAYVMDAEKPVKLPATGDSVEGIGLVLTGTYSAEKLINRLERIVFMLLDEESEFEVELKIKEKQ